MKKEQLRTIVKETLSITNNVLLYATFYKPDETIFNTNGTSEGRNVILVTIDPTSSYRPAEEEMPDDDKWSAATQVGFIKLLSNVFIDYDDFELEKFGLSGERLDNAMLEVEEYIKNKNPYSIDKLVKFGLSKNSNKFTWYGCYVNKIEQSEIKSVNNI